MTHVGDITKLSGFSLPPVDCVTGGSPCQDLSVAGKRAGLAGERSGLLMEQVRVIKELRESDRNRGRSGQFIRPRFMVWENVPGAFSSNHGGDFAAVLHKRLKSPSRKSPLFLCLRKDGPMQDVSWETDGALPGEYTTLSFGECPSEENVSRLSQILEDTPHPKYYLSAKACQGILNRARRRGKQLPEELERALVMQAHTALKVTPSTETPA